MRGSTHGAVKMPGTRFLLLLLHDTPSMPHSCALEGSYAPVCAKLRAETSNIVGCVAEMCHELETAPVLRGARSKRATQPSQGQDAGKSTQEAARDQGGGDLVAGGTGISVQVSHVGADEVETRERAGLSEHKQLSGGGCGSVEGFD